VVYKNLYAPEKGALTPLKEVLDNWLILNDRYYEDYGDIVSCYGELASVSHLNAAAWSCSSGSWLGLQEYHAKKANTENGRIDLHLYSKKHKIGYAIEAKHIFLEVDVIDPDAVFGTITKNLEKKYNTAKLDAAKVLAGRDTDIDRVLAITFFDFQSSSKNKTDKLKRAYLKLNEKFKNRLEGVLAHALWMLEKPIYQDKTYYLGTALLIEVV